MRQVLRCLLLVPLLAFALFGDVHHEQTVFTVSGTSQTIGNPSGAVSASFEELITGSPSTVSIVIQGCMSGKTCTTLETNTSTTAAQVRSPTIPTVYDYFNISASWTGGTSTTVTVNSTSTTAVGVGSGSGSGASSGGNPALAATGMIADYQLVTQNSGTSLTDYSGNGNAATFPGSTHNPTWAAAGGLAFASSGPQYVPLPAAVLNAKAITVAYNFPAYPGLQTFKALLAGTVSPAFALWFPTYDAPDGTNPYVASWANGPSNSGIQFRMSPTGTHVITLNRDASNDVAYFDNVLPGFTGGAGSQGIQTSGTLWLGGGNAPGLSGARGTNGFDGTIYRIIFWTNEQTAGQAALDNSVVTQNLTNQGIAGVPSSYAGPNDLVVLDGDSETTNLCSASGGCIGSAMPASTTLYDTAIAGSTTTLDIAAEPTKIYPMAPSLGRALLLFWIGTNDQAIMTAAQSFQQANSYLRNANLHGYRTIATTMMSRTGIDVFKDGLNALYRARGWANANGLADVGGDINIGCDGCSTSLVYFADGVHLTQFADTNIVWPIYNRAVARFYGAQDFSSANVYSSAAAAAVATTAGSESGNTITITFAATPANCQVGNMITLASVTPTGYNTDGFSSTATTGGSYLILTRSSTQITAYASATGLGVITGQGTGVCPAQQDADAYAVLNFGTGNFTLETCDGYTGQNINLKNINGSSSTVVPFGSETIDGAASVTVAAKATLVLQSILVSSAAGGCSWKQLQNN
jgi:hypothetical protein